jgi:ArsR family transcriptional regulator
LTDRRAGKIAAVRFDFSLTAANLPPTIRLLAKYGNIAVLNDAFQALADPTRREILRLLKAREMTAGELAERFPLAKSTLSGHFNVLRHAGLILADKQGTTITYSLNVSAFEEALAGVMELFQVGRNLGKRASS